MTLTYPQPTTPTREKAGKIKVWDIGVRLFHWSLVAGVFAAYLFVSPRWLHLWLGYAVAGLIVFRLVWGFIGPRHARFADFVPGPRRLTAYLQDMAKGREKRHIGHNPAGGAMVVALLLTLAAISVTGYMMGMDAWFGEEWLEELHEGLVSILLLLVALHVGGVLLASHRHRENLVLAMITGQKMADEAETRE